MVQSVAETKLGGDLLGVEGSLVRTLEQVVAQVPGRPERPQVLARTLGINKDLSSRVLNGLRQVGPLAAIHALPGPGPLRQLLAAASEHGVDARLIEEATEAVDRFDELIRDEFGGRAGLDALISASLPDARERFEATARQAIYRGFAGIRGVNCETMLTAFMVGPPRGEAQRASTVVANGYFRLCRTRPGAHFEFSATQHPGLPESRSPLFKDGSLVLSHCSPEPPPVEITVEQRQVRYVLGQDPLGQRDTVDLVAAEQYQANHPNVPSGDDDPVRYFYATVDVPANALLFDVFVHRDLWPGVDPECVVYDTSVRGGAEPNSPSREGDRLDLHDSVTTLGTEPRGFRCTKVPRYQELLKTLAAELDCDPDEFRGYRWLQSYPIYASQICLLFDTRSGGTGGAKH